MTDPLLEIIGRHWGYSTLRPLQREAMDAACARRDSLVVLPTGGGKSLCYQAPALLSDGVTVVVSPLISLMKDQVDALLARNVPAAFLNSSLELEDRRRVSAGLARGEYKLIFVSPERFAGGGFFHSLKDTRVSAFAIDEAHCISHWGHDFRADYRELGLLKKVFPDVSVHAFTATATPRVRADIVEQLALRDPAILVGDFFRPNLRYRADSRTVAFDDVMREISARPGQAGIVYCIRRADVDSLAKRLKAEGVRVVPYHAGMDDDARTRAQEKFAAGKADVVVATVAFGMGIDRADIRFVIHAAMPQSLEHYQQETGRAGRDGNPADCILFHSGGDYGLWRSLVEKNGGSEDKMRLLSEMYSFCRSARCRHRSLVEYFGQTWTIDKCGACDVCNATRTPMPGGADFARRVLEGVRDTEQRFGAGYVADVLVGSKTERILANRHGNLPSYGVLSVSSRPVIMSWLGQLADADFLLRDGEYQVLKLTATGWQVVRGETTAPLYGAAPVASKRRKARPAEPETETVDAPSDLFERLRDLRRRIASERSIPAFMVFSDKTLRAMAQARPRTKSQMLEVHGVGPAKWESFGAEFIKLTAVVGSAE